MNFAFLTELFLIPFIVFAFSKALASTKYEKATFAGGCFWCMESPFEKIDGVIDVVSGYTGGGKADPTYQEVSSGKTGHMEAVEITFDPSKVSYSKLLEVFWMQIDPTDDTGQFVDRGSQYRTAVFYHSDEQKRLAEESKNALLKSGRFSKPIVTQILKAQEFYLAEDYHQDYYKKCSIDYKRYRSGSGRESFLERIWVDADKAKIGKTKKTAREDLKKSLTPIQYKVTQEKGTEPPFNNEYWNNKIEGIYVDVISGEPLFSSKDKFDSGTGWPSFRKPLESSNIVEKKDTGHGMERTEVRSKDADSHLGHVFKGESGPRSLRYCINSASLRFIPKEDLEKEGYKEYLKLFDR